MENKVFDLNREDMKVLEGYIKNIEKLRYRLRIRELELMDKPVEDNPGGGQSNLPGDPVNRVVSICLSDDYYRNLDKIIRAVENVYQCSSSEVQDIFKLKYWEPTPGIETWGDIGDHLHYSKTHVLRLRADYLKKIANRIDFVNSDF